MDSSDTIILDKNEHVQPRVHRCNWLLEHPKYVEMKSWNLENDEQIFVTLVVYINLCEAKDWWNVAIHPCRELQLAFITGKPSRKDDVRIVLPITSNIKLTHERLQKFLQYIHLPETPSTTMDSSKEPVAVSGETSHSVTLAITESGSTIVYYKITNGLVPPSDPPKEDGDDEKVSQRKRQKKTPKKGGPSPAGVNETVTEYVNEEEEAYRDEFMEEEI
ncbi:uncharacterized protein LOC117303529 [Asterias rubens]|uniref:uncharacterized protein LOC117303529 n=1 Tax=Asterias rubens TaxID=7604 RepID=UPI0014553D91|nr:uncharacterized protein LOC117303529 [Asterias rubens]